MDVARTKHICCVHCLFLFFDIIIEGISLLSSERVEIGALLDERNGNIARLTRDLVNLG